MARVASRKREVAIKPHGSEKLLREVKKLSAKALAVLEKGMDSDDEKIRILCAKQTLQFELDLEKAIDASEISRLVISMKTQNNLTTVPQNNHPVLNFHEVSPEFRDMDEPTIVNLEDIKQIG